MFIKKLDYLSHNITLYYKNSLSHSSIISGILSIISFCIIFISGIYFSLDLIKRKNPEFYYLDQFVEDAGEFPINSSSLFHYISMSDTNFKNINKGFDFRSFKLIGIDSGYIKYLENNNIEQYDHWIYGLCNNETDTKGIGHLITNEEFKNSACIKKYYNSLEKKYYITIEKEFRWPTISHGNFNPNYTFYQIIIDKCDRDTLKLIFGDNYHCKSDNETNIYFEENFGIYLNFIDQYIDISNYK